LTLGIACIIGHFAKIDLEKVKDQFKVELKVAQSVANRLGYFDSIKKMAKQLTQVAQSEMDS